MNCILFVAKGASLKDPVLRMHFRLLKWSGPQYDPVQETGALGFRPP